ncbi:MAG: hypothetical protein AMXMBFR13_27970 [Phycisphaerae bacterium]
MKTIGYFPLAKRARSVHLASKPVGLKTTSRVKEGICQPADVDDETPQFPPCLWMSSASRSNDSNDSNYQHYMKPEMKKEPANHDDRSEDRFEELLELVIRYLNHGKGEQEPEYRHGVVEAEHDHLGETVPEERDPKPNRRGGLEDLLRLRDRHVQESRRDAD